MSDSTISVSASDELTVCREVHELKSCLNELRTNRKTAALVPTMGALHEGHLSLIEIAKEQADIVIVSIFVNPTQFGPNEDYETYPRQFDKDVEKCRDAGVDVVFSPDREEVYSDENFFQIKISTLNEHMCGGSRPGFFEGIVQVVNKLFNMVEPDVAVFGQKDIQQVQILRQMVREFNHGVKIVTAPIRRANDGLALSSRNTYLSDDERVTAPGLFRSLQYIETQIRSGVHTPKLLIRHQESELEAKGFEIDYLNVFALKTLSPVESLEKGQTYIIAGAAYLGKTRLIDNILIEL
ncbi:pantoate--beta-alanine ligase [Rhodohalobacter sp. SW132]|uniref:pantoate--beta-alanine ligase n=1 Tax=Rhodohalobacter sp. SW132 TaxID=2293433 RepID=UPI000E247899|nr:pantoate--beta-alanine ligase [Rhodohalobacter sp. SW132]REL24148.1 pantoate--beta-alanine ligase [Rhodohalobacter sp. SW132]